ncbi:MAG TPA: 16S rRNA (cytosine(1402)-N(4))-methyltransferase RsmH [Oscillatoriaceae cyanobacterium M33_DOE_052]|uniref:Ribosomal RNA small subunit methyltransferase H n=1 Tax=Planktothricoides sp. SpSt-374 TaxID=2282167 RepID=A0A7C3ZLH2_9CYAN|nr:16S rRNA (cytosine(1402)-N(4))-methyltransferase RsmH [Oscillatoriaceae cyanobacterium M33_DOE_052]
MTVIFDFLNYKEFGLAQTDVKRNQEEAPAFQHVPVLATETIARLEIRPGGHYLDATVGAGGHSLLILAAAPEVRVTAIDRDEMALATAKVNLASYDDRVQFWHGNFAEYDPGQTRFDGIIADLGISSGQIDTPERGFSFRLRGDLDMRMDNRQSLTAAEIVNHWDETKLADLFYRYGEERRSRQIAQMVVRRRPFQTTTELAEAIAASTPRRYRTYSIHPATRVFQALRMAVNSELEALETFLDKAPLLLASQGKIAAISFHSLEDRLVKHKLRESPLVQVLTKKPIRPSAEELARNPRSRSAKLRIAERLTP